MQASVAARTRSAFATRSSACSAKMTCTRRCAAEAARNSTARAMSKAGRKANTNSIAARCTVARSSALIAACALLAGCMQMSESECRTADWYQLGYRDADSYGLRPQVDQYAHLCRVFGVQAAESPYLAGWVDGY